MAKTDRSRINVPKATNQNQDLNTLARYLTVLRHFQTIDPEFPLQYAICHIEIALDEGISPSQLAERTGMALSTVSRIIGALSQHRQKGKPYDLIEVKTSETSRRSKSLTLTPKGRQLIERLNLMLEALND